jgi:hypothetical protein
LSNRRASSPSNLCVPPAAVILGRRGCLARIVVHRWGFSEKDVDHVDRLNRSLAFDLTAVREASVGGRGNSQRQTMMPLLRLGQFRLEHAPSLFQGVRLSFRRADNLLREGCEQRLKPLVPVDRKLSSSP